MVKYLIVIVFLFFCSITDFYPKYRKVAHLMLWLLLSLVAGLRMAGGIDYGAYLEHYSSPEYGYWESGYVLLENIGQYIGLDYHVFQFFITAFSLGVLFWFIRKHSKFPILSISFYLGTYFLFYDMVLNRQMLACAFALIAFDALLEKRDLRFFFFVLVGFFFHVSILILVPFYFVQKYLSVTWMTVILFICITLFLYTFSLGDWLAQNFGLRVLNKGVEYFENDNYQVNLFEYVKIFLVAFVTWLLRGYLDMREVKVYIFAFLLFSCLLLGLSRFEIFVRVSMYFDMLTMILIPLFLQQLKRSNIWLLHGIMLFIFSIFFLYRLANFEGGEFLRSDLYFLSDIL